MSLQKEFKKYYQRINLSEQQLTKLNEIQNKKTGSLFYFLKPVIIGAAVASLVFFIFITQVQDPLDRISKEVAYNHLKNMPSEVLTSDYKIMNEALDKLDFQIIKSNKIAASNLVVGARYCSILGKIAVQIKLRDKTTGKKSTLYQYFPEDKSIFSDQGDVNKIIGDTSVRIWKNQGIVFILAQ